MTCPFCGGQMQPGMIRYDSRESLRWKSSESNISGAEQFWNDLGGIGKLTAAQDHAWGRGKLPADYCPGCKKLIIETDIVK